MSEIINIFQALKAFRAAGDLCLSAALYFKED
jgi:hypothetical protein